MTSNEKAKRFADEFIAVCERHGVAVKICDHGTIFCFCSPAELIEWESKTFKHVELAKTQGYIDYLKDKD